MTFSQRTHVASETTSFVPNSGSLYDASSGFARKPDSVCVSVAVRAHGLGKWRCWSSIPAFQTLPLSLQCLEDVCKLL